CPFWCENLKETTCWVERTIQMVNYRLISLALTKAFAYLLKQWDALNVYCSNGWVEIDNNIAENALRGVAVGRKNWMFAGSDSGGEHAAVLYSLIGTCRLNNVEPEKWLRYVIEHIQDWPANRVRDLLPWKVDLSSQ
ncbi:IS66 family transposase, partial [Escherichia coli]